VCARRWNETQVVFPTRWVMENEFRFTGWMVLMGIFMRGAFPKQTLKDMNRFKAFAEAADPSQ
jgi:hypothetical protein